MSFQSQPPKSSGNGKTTLEKGGRDPPDVCLDCIVKDLLSYFNEIEQLHDAKTEAENKYGIKKEHDCWPEDDIRRAWGKTQKLKKKKDLLKTRHWTLVIMMQIIERQRIKGLFDEGGHLVSCAKLSVNNPPDRMKAERENGRKEDDRRSTVDMSQACGKAQRIKVIPEDRSSQSNAELETVGAAGGVKQCSGGKPTTYSHHVQPYSLSQGQAGTQFPGRSQATRNYFDRLYTGDRPGVALQNDKQKNLRETITYIRIPFSRMFNNPTMQEGREPVSSPYKLIDRLPSENHIIIRKSHAISFNDVTKNAEWVYEILNIDSVIDNCEQKNTFEDYDRGHLAAAANHTWCWQAFSETYLNSNIVPQNHLLNIGPWKTLENRCRELRVKQWINNVHVYSGPLYINDGSGHTNYGRKEGKLVPTYLFKVIIVENSDGTIEKPKCYLMPNKNPTQKDPETYRVNIDDLQRVSGLIFIERRLSVSVMERKIMVTCEGEDYEEIPFFVNKTVIISS